LSSGWHGFCGLLNRDRLTSQGSFFDLEGHRLELGDPHISWNTVSNAYFNDVSRYQASSILDAPLAISEKSASDSLHLLEGLDCLVSMRILPNSDD